MQVLEWGGDYVWITYANDSGYKGFFDFKEIYIYNQLLILK